MYVLISCLHLGLITSIAKSTLVHLVFVTWLPCEPLGAGIILAVSVAGELNTVGGRWAEAWIGSDTCVITEVLFSFGMMSWGCMPHWWQSWANNLAASAFMAGPRAPKSSHKRAHICTCSHQCCTWPSCIGQLGWPFGMRHAVQRLCVTVMSYECWLVEFIIDCRGVGNQPEKDGTWVSAQCGAKWNEGLLLSAHGHLSRTLRYLLPGSNARK